MDNSRMMALLVAGSMICGGFAASAADEAKKAETAKPAETKPEDLFAVVPAVVAEVKGEKITKDMLVAEVMKMFPNGKIPEGVTADNLKAALPGIVKQLVIQKIFETEMAKAGIKPSAEMVKEKIGEEFKKMDKQMLAMITQQLQMQNKTVDQYIDEMSKEPMAQQQIANQMYLEEKVLKNLKFDKTIPADAAKKYYDENAAQFKEEADKPDQIRASHILIAPDGKDDAADKKAQEKAT